MSWNLVTKLVTGLVGYWQVISGTVESLVTKLKTFKARNVASVERTYHFVDNKCQFFYSTMVLVCIYNIQLCVRK